MEYLTTFRLLSVAVLSLMVLQARSELSDSECSSLGFIKSSLKCSSCTSLDDFGIQALRNNCFECCNGDLGEEDSISNDIGNKYAKARLEICPCKMSSYPQVQAFIKSERPDKFSNLEIKYKGGGQLPQIVLIGDDGKVVDTLSITKWDTDTIDEFLTTYLN